MLFHPFLELLQSWIVIADKGKYAETYVYLSVMPAASGMQQPADHSKERRM